MGNRKVVTTTCSLILASGIFWVGLLTSGSLASGSGSSGAMNPEDDAKVYETASSGFDDEAQSLIALVGASSNDDNSSPVQIIAAAMNVHSGFKSALLSSEPDDEEKESKFPKMTGGKYFLRVIRPISLLDISR